MNLKSIQGLVLFFLLITLSGCSTVNLGQQNIMSLVWYQSSGEFHALCNQAYNAARIALDNDFKNPPKKDHRKRAIILDIDETILNNSKASAREATDNMPYPYKWNDWINEANAEAIPGAVTFLNYADSKGVSIFYITNRSQDQAVTTLKNLKDDGFPQYSRDHLFCKGEHDPDTNPDKEQLDKESRRNYVEKILGYRVVLFCGDNLNDFDESFW